MNQSSDNCNPSRTPGYYHGQIAKELKSGMGFLKLALYTDGLCMGVKHVKTEVQNSIRSGHYTV